jgi:hypothetical protein
MRAARIVSRSWATARGRPMISIRPRGHVVGHGTAAPLAKVMGIVTAAALAALSVSCGRTSAAGTATPRPSPNLAAPANRTSVKASRSTGPGRSTSSGVLGCPTQQMGGDSIAPACASVSQASKNRPGISGPPSPAPVTPHPSQTQEGPPGQGPPVISSVSPSSGSQAGEDTVTLMGTGFIHVTEVDFGSTKALAWATDSDTQITATSPPGTGSVDITVWNGLLRSATSPSDQFTYLAPSPSADPQN